MASDKRSFTNFEDFPGDIVAGEYHFPELHNTNTKGKPMMWKAFVRLVPRENIKKYKVNWDPSSEVDDMIHIVDGHLKHTAIPDGVVGQIWSICGRADMNPTTNIPTFIKIGKNIGRANQTNVLTQALITMRSKYLKKMDIGYNTMGGDAQLAEVNPDAPRPYYMMAYHKWCDRPRDPERHIVFPAVASIKFDGTRVQAHSVNGRICFSSRRKKLFPSKPHLEHDLQKVFDKYPGIYLDSEAYIEGSNLNVITGIMARESNKHPNVQDLELNVFDAFVPVGRVVYGSGKKVAEITPASSLLDRIKFLDHMFNEFVFDSIHRIDQEILETIVEYDEYHDDVMADGNEGTVIRNLMAPYEFSQTREIRSYQVRKRKPRYDDKFTVVDYTQGTSGSAVGAIILILETEKGGKRFNADPEDITYAGRYKIYKNMTKAIFDKEWAGKKMKVSYHTLSDDGIPTQPKVSFKNIKY